MHLIQPQTRRYGVPSMRSHFAFFPCLPAMSRSRYFERLVDISDRSHVSYLCSQIYRRSHVCLFCVNDKHANGEKYRHRCGKHGNCVKYPRVVCLYAQILHIQLLRGGLQISAETRHLWAVTYHRVSDLCHGLTICHLSVCIFPTVFFSACHLCAVNSRCVHLCHLYL